MSDNEQVLEVLPRESARYEEAKEVENDARSDNEATEKERIASYRKEGARPSNLIVNIALGYLFVVLFTAVAAYVFYGFFELSLETKRTIDDSINHSLSLLPAYFFGVLGALCKLAMTDASWRENFRGILGAGVIAVIAVLSFKSGLVSIIANAYFSAQSSETEAVVREGGEYANILISLISGMFAYNLFSLMKQAAEMAKIRAN